MAAVDLEILVAHSEAIIGQSPYWLTGRLGCLLFCYVPVNLWSRPDVLVQRLAEVRIDEVNWSSLYLGRGQRTGGNIFVYCMLEEGMPCCQQIPWMMSAFRSQHRCFQGRVQTRLEPYLKKTQPSCSFEWSEFITRVEAETMSQPLSYIQIICVLFEYNTYLKFGSDCFQDNLD